MVDRRVYTTEEARRGIYDTFYQHWNDVTLGWQSISGLTVEPPIVWENVQQVDVSDVSGPWLRAQVRHNGSEHDSFGQDGEGSFRATGIVTIQAFAPLDNDGLIFHDRLVNVVRRAFRGKTGVDTYCGIVFRNARINEVGPEERWFQTNVLADFEYDEEL